jgi:hypothetical protein
MAMCGVDVSRIADELLEAGRELGDSPRAQQ